MISKMNRIPPDTMVDDVVMLLSTDWFLPYWSVIGIEAAEQKLCIQKGCRQIERLEATRQSIRALAKECRLGESAKMKLGDLVDSRPERDQFYKGAWLFRVLIDKLVEDDQLDATIRIVLERRRNKHAAMNDLDFKQLSSRSNTAWDNYIRSLTPEVPSSLSNFLLVDLVVSQLLTSVLAQLTPAQREELLSRFQSIAKSVTGVDVDRTWSTV